MTVDLYNPDDNTNQSDDESTLQKIIDFVSPPNSVARNRAGQIVKNTSDIIPGAMTGLYNILQGATRGTVTAIPGMLGDIQTSLADVMPTQKIGPQFPTTEDLQESFGMKPTTQEGKIGQKLGQNIVSNYVVPGAGKVKDLPAGLSIIGPESKLWNEIVEGGESLANRAFKARKMEAKGISPENIKKETGMARGLDNQWRSETSDFWSSIKGDKPFGELWQEKHPGNKNIKVKDVFEHPELFKHYPELADIDVVPHSVDKPYRGAYDPVKNEISIREDLKPEEARSVMLHELTHPIQYKEGMNIGGSPEDIAKWMKESGIKEIHGETDPYKIYKMLGGEMEARMVQERRGLTESQLREHYPYQKGQFGLDIDPDKALIHKYEPGMIHGPSKSEIHSEPDYQGYYSPLEHAINSLKQNKGTGEQFLKQLEKTPGVKTDELDITGVKKFLQENPNVTKEQLVNHIKNNRLELEEHVLTPAESGDSDSYQLYGDGPYHDEDLINSHAEDLAHDYMNDEEIHRAHLEKLLQEHPERYEDIEHNDSVAERLMSDVEDSINKVAHEHATDMYYENPVREYHDEHGYTIYGNDDYGYTVYDDRGNTVRMPDVYDLGELENELRLHHLEEGHIQPSSETAQYEDWTLPGDYKNYREVLTALPEQYTKGKTYQSGHFEQPNILGHIRLTDRTINGKKTLMVEEIQSDWHQTGRKKGYDNQELRNKLDELSKERDKVFTEFRNLPVNQDGSFYKKRLRQIDDELIKLQSSYEKSVPDAPFKKNWHELLTKQALDIASKGDYDAIAFTTGKQQAERYGLSKHLESLSYNPETHKLYGRPKSTNQPRIEKTIEPDKLADYVGEEVANKLLKSEKVETNHEQGKIHHLEGLNLEVGGEGMKGFYDKILPDYINKYTKKWGTAMKKAKLPDVDEEVHYLELPKQAKEEIQNKGQPMFAGIGLAGVPMMGPDDQKKDGIYKDIAKQKK